MMHNDWHCYETTSWQRYENNERCCNATAAVHTAQQCSDNMHIQEDSGTNNNQEEASGDSDCFMRGRSCYKWKWVYKLKNGD